MLLYELNPPKIPLGEKCLYEAETHTKRQGMPRYDAESSGKFSVLSEKGTPGFVTVVSTIEKIPEGRYKVLFKMKRQAKPSKSLDRIARIDVVSPDTRRLLEAKNLSMEDFPGTGIYQEFVLFVDLKKSLKLDFRVYSDGLAIFYIDLIRFEKISGV